MPHSGGDRVPEMYANFVKYLRRKLGMFWGLSPWKCGFCTLKMRSHASQRF